VARGERLSDARGVSEIAAGEKFDRTYVSRVMCLAFLAPDPTRRILEDDPPPAMALTSSLARELPLSWEAQRRIFAYRPPALFCPH
jgi:hypothetical protein